VWLRAACRDAPRPWAPATSSKKQEIRLLFQAEPQPRIHISAHYQLKNTGNQPLDSLTLRLPGSAFHPERISVTWDGQSLSSSPAENNPRDSRLRLPQTFSIGAMHALHFEYDLAPTADGQSSLALSADAFALPAEEWSPALPQAPGVFGFGGVPPKKWDLVVQVPQDFLVHASGGKEKRSSKSRELRFPQTAQDLNPFVVAGRYLSVSQNLPGGQEVRIWTRAQADPAVLHQAAESISRTLATYGNLFGARGKSRPQLWIVECPFGSSCPLQRKTGFGRILFGEDAEASAQILSQDTVLIRPYGAQGKPQPLAAPALAAGWLGYGQNPGFYEQLPPMSALPAFAVALAREASEGNSVRQEIVGRALAQIPPDATRKSNDDPAVTRAKSLLLFYALRDRLGDEPFRHAMQHMLSARQRRGFDVTDLISAIEEETRQPIGPFIRQWIKGPGIPQDFRAKYSQPAVSASSLAQEATQ
jgi:hypothetical protein